MRVKTVLKMVVLLAVTFGWVLPAMSEMVNNTVPRSAYEGMFEDYVKKTESKARMSDSKSRNLRQAARISSLKASYLKKHKDIFIDEMIRTDMPLKDYRMQRFLSEQFFSDYPAQPAFDDRVVKADQY